MQNSTLGVQESVAHMSVPYRLGCETNLAAFSWANSRVCGNKQPEGPMQRRILNYLLVTDIKEKNDFRKRRRPLTPKNLMARKGEKKEQLKSCGAFHE